MGVRTLNLIQENEKDKQDALQPLSNIISNLELRSEVIGLSDLHLPETHISKMPPPQHSQLEMFLSIIDKYVQLFFIPIS